MKISEKLGLYLMTAPPLTMLMVYLNKFGDMSVSTMVINIGIIAVGSILFLLSGNED